MEKVLKLGGERSQSIDITLDYLVTERWSVESYKNKYVNGKQSGQIPVGYKIYLDNTTDYLLEEGDGEFQITPRNSAGGTSAICSLTQEESGEQIDINIYTPETKVENDILVSIKSDPFNGLIANLEISARHEVASDINFSMVIKYGVSPGDTITRETTLNSGDSYTAETVNIQKEATPLILSGDYWPKEDDKYKYIVSFM
nr:MAG: hypothetical protein [Bacteriophage sp.]